MAARKRYMRDLRRAAREVEESKQNGMDAILIDYRPNLPGGPVNGVKTVSSPTEECDPCGEPSTDV
jgi:hypothetical protein